MSRNHRKHAHTVQVAAVVWWLIVFSFLGGVGLSYVSLKNQTIAFGNQRRQSEDDLRVILQQNSALSSQADDLNCQATLRRKYISGSIKMVEIDPEQIVRLKANRTASLRLDENRDALLTSAVPLE